MKTLPSKAKISGLTLVEVLVVIFVLAILVALLLPALAPAKRGHQQFQCVANQNQIAVACVVFQDDNGGKYPWQLSATNGGAMELSLDGHPSSQFRPLFPYVRSFTAFICPSDSSRHAATNYETLSDQNISYFVNVDATTNKPSNSILSGDRFLAANGQPVKPGLFIVTSNLNIGWMPNIHFNRGSLSFADGHALFLKTDELRSAIQQQPLATNRFAIP
jgi:competence protein ComGC